jgi:hypothetical protein
MRSKRRRMTTVSRIELVLGGAILLMMPIGCTNDDVEARNDAEQQIHSAKTTAVAMTTSEATPYPPDQRTDSLKQMASTVSGVTGTAAQNAAKHSFASSSASGIGRLRLDEAIAIELMVIEKMDVVEQTLDQAIKLDTVATAKESASFAEASAFITEQERQVTSRRNDLNREALALEQRVRDLENESASELAEYSRLREESARIKDSARDALLEDQIKVLNQARDIGREADRHQARASNLDALVDTIQPELDALRRELIQADDQLANLSASRIGLQAKEDRLAAEAEQLRDQLAERLATIDREMQTIAESRGNALLAAYNDAIREAEAAVSAAQASQREDRNRSSAARLAATQQFLGEVQWTKARGLQTYATFLGRVSQYGELLRRDDKDNLQLENVRNELQEATDAAAAAMEAAMSSAESLSGSTEYDNLIASLGQTIGVIRGESVAAAPRGDTPMGDTPSVDTPTRVAGPSESPAELFSTLISTVELGDFVGVVDLFHPATDADRQLLGSMRTIVEGATRLNTACQTSFNMNLVEIAQDSAVQDHVMGKLNELNPGGGDAPGGLPGMEDLDLESEIAKLTSLDVDSLEFGRDSAGTTAWVENQPDLADMQMVYVDGAWKFLMESPPGQAEMAVGFFGIFEDNLNTILSTVAQKTENDMYATPVMMVDDFMTQLFMAFMSLQGELENMITPEMMNPGGGQDK